jgi:ABC-type uncharacterized transport system involved in gliding motility auxiliary subunit
MQINSKKNFIVYSLVLFAALVVFNMISRNKFFRWDLTDNKMYSLSESSKSVVSKIDDLMTLKVYFSNNLMSLNFHLLFRNCHLPLIYD